MQNDNALLVPPQDTSSGEAGTAPVERSPAGTSPDDVIDALRGGASHETLALIDELKNPAPTSLASQLGVLAVSLLLFLAAGLLDWSVGDLLLVVFVLLVHETGHLLAMKALGYRDVRMFFIPFFGAAVSGLATRASGARRSVVSLAGPVPGLVLGVVLGVGYALTRHAAVGNAAMMFLILNAFNLLPLLPLDGGRVLLETVFIRNRWLEALFQVGGGLGLLLLAFGMGDPLFGVFALLILKGVPQALKVGRTAAGIRAASDEGLPASIADAPLPFMVRMVDEVDAVFGELTPKERTGIVRAVFERLHPDPPRAFATIGLLAVYVCSFVIAFIGLVIVVMVRSGMPK